jgi:hypothetical protein
MHYLSTASIRYGRNLSLLVVEMDCGLFIILLCRNSSNKSVQEMVLSKGATKPGFVYVESHLYPSEVESHIILEVIVR